MMQVNPTLYFTYSIMGSELTISTMEQNLSIGTDTFPQSGHLTENSQEVLCVDNPYTHTKYKKNPQSSKEMATRMTKVCRTLSTCKGQK